MTIQYFYDEQFRRALIQITRIFNGLQYSYTDTNGNQAFSTVPSIYGFTNKQAASIVNGNSENTTLTLPIFVTYPKSVDVSSERRQNPTYVRENHVTEREISNGAYTANSGARYTVKTMMPVPIDLRVNVELITTNQAQKYQLLEQIIVLFNPEVEIQTSVNALDWTAITYARLEDIFISPTQTLSTSGNYDTTTFELYVPMWINPPAKVSRQKLIQEVIINMDSYDNDNPPEPGELMHQTIVTPGEYSINVSDTNDGNGDFNIKLIPNDDTNYSHDWNKLLEAYGKTKCCSKLYLLQDIASLDNNMGVISGNIKGISDDGQNLLWNVNTSTLPQSKYPNNIINAIIDPNKTYPPNIPATDGVTYMILSDIAKNEIWGNIYYNNSITKAKENDIIQYSEELKRWNIIFKASDEELAYYTVSTSKGDQYLTYENNDWRLTVDAEYSKGFWRLQI